MTMWFRKIIIILIIANVLAEKDLKIAGNNVKRAVSEEGDDGRSSLAFVFDTTGSMYNDLRQLRQGAEMILKTALEESNVIADFVFVPFHDPVVGPATVTRNKEIFKSALNIVHVYGGGDCPEKSLGGIQLALNVSRPRSFLYVFTDATAGDHRLVGKVLDAVQRKQSQVVFVLTGHCNDLHKPSYKVYQQIAAASSGQIFNLNKTSVHEVLHFVKNAIKGRTVNLGSIVKSAGYNFTQGIPVDSTVGEVTVSVSGAKPQIKVVDPSGEELTGPPKLVKTLDLSEIMVVKVLDPEPGNWNITVGSEKDYSVKVVGLSNLTFDHGFSVEPPSSMAETSYRPLQGTYNYMTLSLSGTDKPLFMKYAEVVTLDGKTLFEVPLREIDMDHHVYLTDAFVPPDDFFYIAINGRDELNHEVRRVGATAVQAKTPDVPYLTTTKKLEVHSHTQVLLKCKVESLVPVTVQWTKDSINLQPETARLQTTSIEYVIKDMTENDVGIYSCVAKNVAGVSKAFTEVVLLVDPPQVVIEPDNSTIEFGENVTITCTVLTEALILKHQLMFSGTEKDSNYTIKIDLGPNIEGYYTFVKIINNATEKHQGIYTCIAANRGGQANQSTHITVKAKPISKILGSHPLSINYNTDIEISCHVENAELIKWIESNGSVIERKVNGSMTDVLNINNVTEDGVWQCVAVRGVFNASDSLEVSVLMKPNVIVLDQKNITVLNGTVHEIVCEIEAKPAPTVLWLRGDEKLLTGTIASTKPNVYQSVLTLDTNKEDIKGKYICVGKNSNGSDKDEVTVNVRRKLNLIQGFNDTSVELYSQVELQCQVDGYPEPKIRWFHNTTELLTTNNVLVSEDITTLYLMMIGFKDLGMYTCEADNGFEVLRVNGNLSVFGLEVPVIAKDKDKQITRRGDTTNIACRVIKGNPEPSISWQHKPNNAEHFTSLPINASINALEQVVILNVTDGHSGVYRCSIANILGSDFHDVQLTVQYPPTFLLPEKGKVLKKLNEVKAGERVAFSCNAIGTPKPIVIWTKDGRPLVYSNNIRLSNDNDLIIENATRHDSGMFTCKATSSLGSVHQNFTLYVYVPPKITQEGNETLQEMLEGQLVELPCAVDGEPTPKIQWTHNGNDIEHDRKYIDEFGLRFVANLTDFGNYTCNVWNSYGNTSVSYSLYVWVSPYIKPPLEESKSVLIGSNASLKCDAVGFPIPEIIWGFQNDALLENTTDLSINENGNLFITNVSTKHEGIYDCIAENIVGIARKYIYLKINEPPKILEDNFTGPYIATNMDSAVILTCKATGRPRVHIVWSKDDIYLDKGNHDRYEISADGSLTIKSPTEEETGNYTCIVLNTYGTVNKTFEVQIYALPTNTQADESQSKITLLEGTNATVNCPIQASATDTVKWYKEAVLLVTGILKITNVTRSNSSTLACVVANRAGSGYATVTVTVEWKPNFIQAVETKLEAIKGEDVYLDCQVDAKPAAKIKWLFNSKRLMFQDDYRLKLMSVQLHDTGTYKCILNNDHGTIVREFSLTVLVVPFISEFDILDVLLKEGVNATLECNAKGFPEPNLEWTYNNTNWKLEHSSLSSSNVTSTSEGLYRCDARNKAGTAHLVYRVEVVTSARIQEIDSFIAGEGTSIEKTVEIAVNTRTRISCRASGKPIPTIQWLRNGILHSNNQPVLNYADLVLDNVQTTQAGVYTCLASNEGGRDERKIKVDVLEPPQIFQDLFQNANSSQNHINIEVISGQAFYLHCHPYGNPLPEVYWFKDDLPLRFYDDTMISTDFGEVIIAKKANEENTGNYTCVAKNKVGNTSVSYLVDVLVPPLKPKESVIKIATIYGKELVLACPVKGTPLPNVMWIKHPYIEINEETPRIVLLEDNFSLIINKTEVSDSGNYSCVITNIVGTTEVVFQVTVQKSARIVSNKDNNISENHIVPLKRSIVLKCEVEGNPTPKITWLKDTQQLSDNLSNIHRVLGNSLLAIWSANVRDAGQYICIAENEAGAQHRRYNVIIKGKWSSWKEWSICNVTCGLGYQTRSRLCHFIDENNNTIDVTTPSEKVVLDETVCKGSSIERRKCHMPPCDDEVNNPKWSKWSTCSSSCGSGTQARTRRCKSKAKCVGDNVQIRKCQNLPKCERESVQKQTSSDVIDNKENSNDTSIYIPEAVYEMEPKVVNNDHYSSDIDAFYNNAGPKKPTVYDVNVTENLDHSERGSCDPGYIYNTTTNTCHDIDECMMDHNHCHSTQVCVNTVGGYQCTCPSGYVSLGLGQRCLDINECEQEVHGCEFACVNVAGGYVCACPRHLRLHIDKHHCVHPLHYQRPYEELENADYMSASVEYPARYMKKL